MRVRVALILSVVSTVKIFGAACCLGGGPKSFISLQDLEDLEIGLSSGFRDVYGWYNPYGEVEESEFNQTFSLSLGVGKRLNSDLSVTALLPLVGQTNGENQFQTNRQGIGDSLLGAQYSAYRSLFQEEWMPTLNLLAGVKLPTGQVEDWNSSGRYQPATGNGLWEPYFGVVLLKERGNWRVSLSANFAVHLPDSTGFSDGNHFDLTETLGYVASRRLSVVLGSNQSWVGTMEIQNAGLTDSEGRAIEVFLSPTYFLTQVFSVGASASATVSLASWGMNHQAARMFSVTTRYAFF